MMSTSITSTQHRDLNLDSIDGVANSPIYPVLLFITLAASSAFNCAHIVKDGAPMEVGLDWQVLIKLAFSGASIVLGAWGLLQYGASRRAVLTLPALAIIAILVLSIPAGMSGYSPSSLPATVINMSYVIVVACSLVTLGLATTMKAILLGSLVVCGGSMALFFFAPSYGVYPEFLGSVTVERLGGFSHPNMVGRIAGIGILTAVGLRFNNQLTLYQAAFVVVLMSVTLVLTVSRTATAGCIISLVVLFLPQLKTRNGLRLIAAGAFVLVMGVFALGMTGREEIILDRIGESVSKTGDSRELTSGTGRVAIWGRAIELIREKPATGYGFGAAQSLMEEHSQSPHNTVLHASLTAGIVAGCIMFCLVLWLLNVGLLSQYPLVAAIAIFLVISGLVEDTVLATFPGVATLSWIVCCIHPLRKAD